eukprot:gene3393-292_t
MDPSTRRSSSPPAKGKRRAPASTVTPSFHALRLPRATPQVPNPDKTMRKSP